MASELTFSLTVPGRLSLALEVPAGLTVLFGPSGAGKSTCLFALAGLLAPSQGSITLAGRTLLGDDVDVPPWRRRVALVFQSLALFPHMSVRENVAFGIRDRAQVMPWLTRMRVAHVAERRPATLSGGEAQRVALARALASQPALLLLDEPFSALDRPLRRELAHEVRTMVRELQIPALLVTHDREDADALGDRIVFLREGRLAQDPPPSDSG